MRYGIERKLKKSIDQAALVSFDLYDTLIFRRHGTPWEVFRFMGCLLNQPDFTEYSPRTMPAITLRGVVSMLGVLMAARRRPSMANSRIKSW